MVALLRTTFAFTDPDILALYKRNFSGDGTYYWTSEGGTCSYPPPSLPPVATKPEIKYLVALNAPQFKDSKACGMCLKVHAKGEGRGNDPIVGDFMVFVKDLCPECHEGDIDLAKDLDGRWKVIIQGIQCPVGDTKIEYKFQGSNTFYLKLQVRNGRIPPGRVRVKLGVEWKDMTRTRDGFWTSSGKHDFPIDVELTAANGEVLLDQVPRLGNDEVIHGRGIQFAVDETLSTPAGSASALQKRRPSDLSTTLGFFVHRLCTVFLTLAEIVIIHALS